jgi:8-oxo-dGTP pyrophosphatase MutT (NUDIX family)
LTFDDLAHQLPASLAGRLPGQEGQVRMSPRPRFGWKPGQLPDDARHGGVLLLLFPISGAPHVVLTVRDSALPHHAGQVSLPGGAIEPDESIDEAALREAHEEIGLDPGVVRIIGGLSPLHVPVSGYVLHPRVGLASERPVLRPDMREVARIIEAPLERLRNPATLGLETRHYRNRPVEVPYFAMHGEKVWGATAMVLSEFLCVLGSYPDPWKEDRGEAG